jgi:hypothetical protein
MSLSSAYEIQSVLFSLDKFKNTISEKSDMVKVKIRLVNDLRKLELAYTELVHTSARDLENMNSLTRIISLKESARVIENVQDAVDILTELAVVTEGFNHSDYDLSVLRKLPSDIARYDDRDAVAISIDVLKAISDIIVSNRNIKLFDPRCKTGDNVRKLKSFRDDIQAFGLEQNIDYANIAKTYVDRCIKGTLMGSKVSNDVFDVLFLMPKLTWMSEFSSQGTLKEREEKTAIRNTIKYVRPNGVVALTIPSYRLGKDIAFMLSKMLSDVQVVKHPESPMRYITILGKKNISKEAKQDIYDLLGNLDYANLPGYTSPLNTYQIPNEVLDIQFFRGSVLDDEELDAIVAGSKMYDSFWNKQNFKINNEDQRPLLPFNIGQIGLVLTSGCLDGVIEEYDGQYHAIKGMVTKVKQTVRSNNENNTERTLVETFTNMVQINIFTPDGEFIELA